MSTAASLRMRVFSGRSTRTYPRAAPTYHCQPCRRVPSRPCRPVRALDTASKHARSNRATAAQKEKQGHGGSAQGARNPASHRHLHQRTRGDQVPSEPPSRPRKDHASQSPDTAY
ncbi:hypothetical protein [Human adenovirus 21a]|uniref:12.6 kDa protein n=2 Tax=Human adenovirus 21 TaxID=32608 RepID=A0A075IN58_9ADEN|nr:12.6 kDa protein [Human adenovirus 21a]AJA02165.1 hypothetical 12.6 kDa protein [Human adenovirus 21]AIF29761.1 12.6 kDa protein [Human adenovirus 21a]AIF29809.1 12.6 kDa protein [Human adenovirus 21a]AIF29905.1 12.6 kDa protein [Human adenovirus 21a]